MDGIFTKIRKNFNFEPFEQRLHSSTYSTLLGPKTFLTGLGIPRTGDPWRWIFGKFWRNFSNVENICRKGSYYNMTLIYCTAQNIIRAFTGRYGAFQAAFMNF